jgi:hypothetical protein
MRLISSGSSSTRWGNTLRGKRTAIILGAGASYCYEDGDGPLPLQKDIVGQLGGISMSSGVELGAFIGPAGLSYSSALTDIIQERYTIPADSSPEANRLAFWDELRKRGESLESVYAELERSLAPDQKYILDDFVAILRTSVKLPVLTRDPKSACRYHRRLVERLEPGDFIIDFNWDSLMADVLLYFCPFWFPRTGFGPWPGPLAAIMAGGPKALIVQSLVQLYHVHGSVLLYEMLEGGLESKGSGVLLYLGPQGYPEINSLESLLGFSPENPQPTKTASDVERRAIRHGYLHCEGRWFKPLFIPPSMEKGEYRHWYHRTLRTAVHTMLPRTECFLIIGYSFPPADANYLSNIFVPGVIRGNAEGIVVNPDNPDPEFQSRVRKVFSSIEKFDFTKPDFKTFSAGLEDTGAHLFAC